MEPVYVTKWFPGEPAYQAQLPGPAVHYFSARPRPSATDSSIPRP